MTLGGSPEPLTKSIAEHKPERIIFFASHNSVIKAAEIVTLLNFKPQIEYEITEDPNSLYECYKAARRCVDRINKCKIEPKDIIVDYTGGTKVMTAALILATIGKPYQFNYVGGDQQGRNKDGLGTVINGNEKLYQEMSPWSIFAEEERRQIKTLFNRHRYAGVIEIIECCDKALPIEVKDYFSFVRPIAKGLLHWEQFNHRAALRSIEQGIKALERYSNAYNNTTLAFFNKMVQECRNFLNKIMEYTNKMQKLHPILVEDLLNNARRRIEKDKRYDDAAARLYRAIEMYGQILFEKATGHSTDKVPPNIIPETLRDEFNRHLDSDKNFFKLPLTATYRYLKFIGDHIGVKFSQEEKKIKNILSTRNNSILAHGIKPISKHAISSIFNTVCDFLEINTFIDFPKLP